jgi:hypothetical protein
MAHRPIEFSANPLRSTGFAVGTPKVPLPITWPQQRGGGPWSKRLSAKSGDQFRAIHAHVAGARRNGARLSSRTAMQERWRITADAVDCLRDLE